MSDPNTNREELQHILLAYVEGREHGIGPTLEELIERNPQYTQALLNFAMHYDLAAERAAKTTAVPAGQLEPDHSIERQTLEQAFTQLRNPPALTSLIGRAAQRGYDMAFLAEELELGTDVLMQLERRKITSESLPAQLLEGLGRLLAVSMQQLQRFFARPPSTGVPANAYAFARLDLMPGWRQQTFAEAVQASKMMTPEQQAKWLALADAPVDRSETE